MSYVPAQFRGNSTVSPKATPVVASIIAIITFFIFASFYILLGIIQRHPNPIRHKLDGSGMIPSTTRLALSKTIEPDSI
jgi:hypothetical protein